MPGHKATFNVPIFKRWVCRVVEDVPAISIIYNKCYEVMKFSEATFKLFDLRLLRQIEILNT